MCGITGIYSLHEHQIDLSLLERMNRLLTHRGPDSEGYFRQGHVGLAMRRLKVIDLETGNQPIYSDDKSLVIVFNGEIYNYRELRETLIQKGHRFHTASDTEVILHQYQEEGESCVNSLMGMFAFVIYDAKKDTLFAARDRLGVKPFFYHHSSKGFIFGSELKALLEVSWIPKEPNFQAISDYLSLNYLPNDLTPFTGITQLPPGHYLILNRTGVQIQSYWDIPFDQKIDVSEEEACKTIESLLHKSMERRLIADVPIGVFLSGGLDSSSLVALMKEHTHKKIKTFSVGFDEPAFDETPFARETARYFGTEHYEIHCSANDVIQDLPQVAWHADNLLADQAALSLYIVSRLARQHVTVALSGDGGDEVFVGYPTFHANGYHAIYSRIPRSIRKGIIENFIRRLPASFGKVSFEYKAKKFIETGNLSSVKAHYWWRTIFTEEEKRSLLRPEILKHIHALDAFESYDKYFRRAKNIDFLSRCLYADQKVWLCGNNLYKVDSMTMAHGLEAREPFLDHELIEYMAGLPMHLKFRGGVLKYLQKKVMRSKLPSVVLSRRKAGWHAPIGKWIQGELFSYTSSILKGSEMLAAWCRPEAVEKILLDHKAGKRDNSFKIWGLLILAHWAVTFLAINDKRDE